VFAKGLIQVKVGQMFSGKTRKWIWVGVASFVALQVYFVRELLAALILFTGVFVIVAIIALVIYLVDQGSQWSLVWAGERARPAMGMVRRGWLFAGELSKKPFRRLRSVTVR
jgi:hypothetical protein